MSKNNEKSTEEEVDNVTIEITESEDEKQEIALLNDEYRSKQLKRFDTAVSDAAIAELKETYLPLKVTSVDDKAIAKRIREGRLKARGYRLGVVKLAENIIEAPKNFIKAVNDRRDEIVEELKAFERLTQQEEDLFGQLKIEADEKREKELQEKFDARLARIVELKMEFAGDRYVLGTEAHITNMEIADFSDAEFDGFIENVRPIAADIIRKQEMKKRLEDRKISLRQMGFVDNGEGMWGFHDLLVSAELVAESSEKDFDGILQDAKVIADRVKQEMEDFKANQKKLKEQQDEMDKQKLQMAAQKLALRQDQLKALGMTILEHGSASHEVDFMDKSQIESMADDEFAEWCHGFRSAVWQFENEKAEKERLSQLEKTRVNEMKSLGFEAFMELEDLNDVVFQYLECGIDTSKDKLISMGDQEWSNFLASAKLKKEKTDEFVLLEKRKKSRIQELISKGFSSPDNGLYEITYQPFGVDEVESHNSCVVSRLDIEEFNEEKWAEFILNVNDFIMAKTEAEILWKQDEERKENEAKEARRVALLPDQKKLIEFSAKVAALRKEMPEMATEEGKKIAEIELRALQSLAHDIKAQAEAMS